MSRKEFGISQKEAHCIYVEFGISSEGGTLYLCITCKWNPSKGVWHLSEGGTLYLCITCK